MKQTGKKTLLVWGHSCNQQGGGDQDLTNLLEHFSRKADFALHGTFPAGPRFETNTSYCEKWIEHRGGAFPILYESWLNYFAYLLFAAKQVLHTRKFIRQTRADAILFSSSSSVAPFIWSLTIPTKRFVMVREVISPRWLMRLIFRFLYNRADAIFTVSNFLKTRIEEIGVDAPIFTIYSLPEVNLNGLQAQAKDKSRFRIACVGGICKNKGQHKLIKACDILEDPENIELHFFGKIPTYWPGRQYYENLRRYQEERNLEYSIFYHGTLPNDQLLNQLSGFDLIAIPSDNEGLSLVLLEAILLKVPVIASRIGEIQYIIEDEVNGLLFEPHDINAIAKCIDRMRRNQELYDRIKDNLGVLPVHLGSNEQNLAELLSIIEGKLA